MRDGGGLTHQPEFSGGKGMILANISCLYIYNLYSLVCVCFRDFNFITC